MSGRRDSWSDEELAVLREHYAEHGPSWDGWAELLPLRTYYAIQVRARMIGISAPKLGMKYAPRKHRVVVRPATCGQCRFYREGELPGVGRCHERHARIMFGREPEVLARYEAEGLCDWGEAVDGR